MTLFNNYQFAVVLAIGAVALWYAKDKAGELANAVSPTNNNNIFSRGVDAVVDVLDDGVDNDSNSLGTLIYEKTHGE